MAGKRDGWGLVRGDVGPALDGGERRCDGRYVKMAKNFMVTSKTKA